MHGRDPIMGCMAGTQQWDAWQGPSSGTHGRDPVVGRMAGTQQWDACQGAGDQAATW